MLASQTINFPFGVGLDEKIANQITDPSTNILFLKNLRINKSGSFHKRHGYTALSRLVTAAVRLGQHNGAPIGFDGFNLNTYIAQTDAWSNMGSVSNAIATRQPVASAADMAPYYDIAYANGVYALMYAKNTSTTDINIFVSLIDAATGNVIVPHTLLFVNVGGLPKFRALAVADTFVFLLVDGSTNSLIEWTANSLAPASPVEVVGFLATDVETDVGGLEIDFDVVSDGNAHFVIAYRSTAAPTALRTSRFLVGSAAVTTSAVHVAPAAIVSIGVSSVITNVIWIGVNGPLSAGNSTVWGFAINPITMAVAVAFGSAVVMSSAQETQTITIVPRAGNTAMFVGGIQKTPPGGTPASEVAWATVDGTSGTTAISNTGGRIFRFIISGKVFKNTDILLPVVSSNPLQPTGYLIRLGDALVGTFEPHIGYAFPVATYIARVVDLNNITNWAPSTIQIAAGKYVVPYPQKQEFSATSIDLVTLDFTQTNQWQNDTLGASMVFSAGTPGTFDGLTPTEVAFTESPIITANKTGSGGTFEAGTYSYTFIYEWVSASGEVAQSAPSDIAQVTTVTGNTGVAITVTTLQLSYKISNSATSYSTLDHPVRIVGYRTTAGGTVYLRLPDATIELNNPTLLTNTSIVSFTDSTPDANLGALLYVQPLTPGTALAHLNPPSAACMVVHRNRLYLASDDGITVYYSGQFIDGEQPWFSDQFTFQVPKGGPITAMESMDGVLYIFKRDFVFSVTGDGPADNRSGNDLSTPEEIDVEVGCIEPRSLVVAPSGIFYQAPQGLYMLTRSRTASYVGQNVETRLNEFSTIVSADISDKNGCIYWEIVSPINPDGNGITVVYDYIHNQWMLDYKTHSTGGAAAGAASSEVINGVYYWITPGGLFSKENAGYLDYGNWVTGEVDTSYFKLAGLQGFQRIRKIGVLVSRDATDTGSFGLEFDALRDYDDSTPFQSFAWSNTELDALSTPLPQIQLSPRIQKVESMQILMRDVPPLTGDITGIGPIWLGLILEVGIKQGMDKLPAANTK